MNRLNAREFYWRMVMENLSSDDMIKARAEWSMSLAMILAVRKGYKCQPLVTEE